MNLDAVFSLSGRGKCPAKVRGRVSLVFCVAWKWSYYKHILTGITMLGILPILRLLLQFSQLMLSVALFSVILLAEQHYY
jgi:hypothetical protein